MSAKDVLKEPFLLLVLNDRDFVHKLCFRPMPLENWEFPCCSCSWIVGTLLLLCAFSREGSRALPLPRLLHSKSWGSAEVPPLLQAAGLVMLGELQSCWCPPPHPTPSGLVAMASEVGTARGRAGVGTLVQGVPSAPRRGTGWDSRWGWE